MFISDYTSTALRRCAGVHNPIYSTGQTLFQFDALASSIIISAKSHCGVIPIPISNKSSLTVPSQVERLAEISEFIDQAARASGLNDDQSYDAQMAVDEACTNVIKHAYHGRKNGKIEIACESRRGEFIITIRDWGKEFDPSKVAVPRTGDPLTRRKIGGLGLFFMQKMMDSVKFSFARDQGNTLVMTKKIKK